MVENDNEPIKLLSYLYDSYGPSYFRFKVPSKYFSGNLKLDFHRFRLNKFKPFPYQFSNTLLKSISGHLWDNFKVTESFYFTTKAGNYDAVLISRSLLSFNSFVDFRIKNFFYDFDDAVFLDEAKHCFKYYCKNSIAVFAGNSFLAERAEIYSSKVFVIPTSVDTNRYKRIVRSKGDFFVIGWIGGSGGFIYFKKIIPQLLSFFQAHQDARLLIVSDRYPIELEILYKYIIFKEWSIESDAEFINEFDVGIMPLFNNDNERGKCSLKMLQYMACEVPVIVSAVGMNNDVISHERKYGKFGEAIDDQSWYDALHVYYALSSSERKMYGEKGRVVINKHFSSEIISHRLHSIIMSEI